MDKNSPSQFMVAKGLQELIINSMPQGRASDAQVTKLLQYFMRILSSKLGTLNKEADLDHIKTLMAKKISTNFNCKLSIYLSFFYRISEVERRRRGTFQELPLARAASL